MTILIEFMNNVCSHTTSSYTIQLGLHVCKTVTQSCLLPTWFSFVQAINKNPCSLYLINEFTLLED